MTTPSSQAPAVLADPDLAARRASLITLCARAECELEVAWSRHVITSRVPALTLQQFPYHHNYALLTALEHGAITQATAGRPPRRALFVGAGPLPLSSLHLRGRLGVPVDNLDRSLEAVALARHLAAGLGLPDMSFRHGDIGGEADLARYDLVVLAALVGLTPHDKDQVLAHLHQIMAPGATLLARSVHGLRALLYPTIDPASLHGFDLVSLTHPTGPVLNSVVVARRPPPR